MRGGWDLDALVKFFRRRRRGRRRRPRLKGSDLGPTYYHHSRHNHFKSPGGLFKKKSRRINNVREMVSDNIVYFYT